MRTRTEYAERASAAYERYLEVQARIDNIESRALDRFKGNKGLAAHHLKTAPEYWLYRDLVGDRGIQNEIAILNATMAGIASEFTIKVPPKPSM